MCRGACKGTFHKQCVFKKEGRRVIIDKSLFICFECDKKVKQKLNPGLLDSSQQTPMEIDGAEEQEEEKYPWESTDPEIAQYYADSEENRLLDKLIAMEVE